MPGTWGDGDLVHVRGTGGCQEDESLCTARGKVAGIGITVAGHRSLYSFSHSVSGKCQTQEHRAATWPGKKNKVLMQKCCSWVENVKVERSREGSLLLLLSQWWPLECLAPGGVAGCGGAHFAVVGIK